MQAYCQQQKGKFKMKKYFATFKEIKNEIAVFNTKEERDEWVSFNDGFSVLSGTNKDNAPFQRVAISARQARAIAGNRIYIGNLENDSVLDNVRWLILSESELKERMSDELLNHHILVNSKTISRYTSGQLWNLLMLAIHCFDSVFPLIKDNEFICLDWLEVDEPCDECVSLAYQIV